MEYKTTAQRAAEIRAALKAKGYGRKDVSVRSHSYSMGSSINIRALHRGVKLDDLRIEARKHEAVSYDERTGEILGGGNRYVHVTACDGSLAGKTLDSDRIASTRY